MSKPDKDAPTAVCYAHKGGRTQYGTTQRPS
jgi:hypothetical protein